ncbi:hypothetical protein AeMF1_005634 [Aphanomyces euteiches]|nr:hypothetical protein AeMF1_005634 [Aphanomyces euteiches]KAH9183997.1 hypothetical protein AeNC1_014026 [Aphanomyces euteiches]
MAVEKTARGRKAKKDDQPQPEAEKSPKELNVVKREPYHGLFTWWYGVIILISLVTGYMIGRHLLKERELPDSIRMLVEDLLFEEKVTPIPPTDLFAPVGNKYESEVVQISTRKLLTPDPSCPEPVILDAVTHVDDVLGRAEQLRQDGKVFLMLNGQNEGVYAEWTKENGCLHALTETAALVLGSDPDYFANGLRLYNGMGYPITTADELDAERVAYILVDFQIWVWPGIHVGYTRIVDNVKMTTISLVPLVFDTEGFFTLEEANLIIEHGSANLQRSPVDSPDAVGGYHSDRTSHTAFLDDSQFTRNFRTRTASLARLPSPSFVERMQLVRYEAGQFFRKHEDYFRSKSFLGKKEVAWGQYTTWCKWAASTIDAMQDRSTLPEDFHPGNRLYPRADDEFTWQLELLKLFLADTVDTTFYSDRGDVEWKVWIEENVANNAQGIIGILLKDKAYMLEHIIASWSSRTNTPALQYTIPKEPPSAVSQYFRWIRWAKELIADLGNKAPVHVRTNGKDYPSFYRRFQNDLVNYILKDHTTEDLVAILGQEWADWLETNKAAYDVIIDGARHNPIIFDLAVQAWTKRAGPGLFDYQPPAQLKHFEPNRFVTLFLYLNDVDEGGETVFPHSKERLVTNIAREGMDECSEGLAVPPTKLHASLFYAQTPDNELDPMSLHGGCPPAKGVKFGANSFTWNADADEGSDAWGF